MRRCPWCERTDIERVYHDNEWGVPVFSDEKQFEFLVLESAQAGLSWLTVLRKRENYRRLYDGFDPEKVARYGEEKIRELMSDSGIIRNRKKIEASINNAARFLEIRDEFGSFLRLPVGIYRRSPGYKLLGGTIGNTRLDGTFGDGEPRP